MSEDAMSDEKPPDFGLQIIDRGGGGAIGLFSIAIGLAIFVWLVTGR